MSNYEEIKAKYVEAGQEQVFTFWDSLNAKEKEELLANLKKIDINKCNKIFKAATKPQDPAKNADKITPIPKESIDSVITPKSPGQINEWRSKGLELIAANKVAIILLAGGQGTRLGSSAPKGCYDIGLQSHKSLFELQAERIKRLQIIAKEHAKVTHEVSLPWYVMTSGPTRKPTEDFFKEKNFFGLDPKNVIFFEQGVLPAFTNEGKLFLETKTSPAFSPDGNGGIYTALTKEGVIADLEKRKIPYVAAYCVDNCLVKVADPTFIGYCVSKGADCAAKSVPKSSPEEQVGVICLKNDKFSVVEYSEIDQSMAEQREPNGQLTFNAANIANHFYTTEFLKQLDSVELDYHIARKKIKHTDLTSGEFIIPTKNNGIKLELFIFDVFPITKNMTVLEVPRKDDFSPLKNASGSGVDCPETSKADIQAQSVRFILSAGAKLADESGNIIEDSEKAQKLEFELSPLLSYDGEGLEKLAGKIIKTPANIQTLNDLQKYIV